MTRPTDEKISSFDKWLTQCGPCDHGLPFACTCPDGDYRPAMLELRDLVVAERKRADDAKATIRNQPCYHIGGCVRRAHAEALERAEAAEKIASWFAAERDWERTQLPRMGVVENPDFELPWAEP